MKNYIKLGLLFPAILVVHSAFAGHGWKRVNYTNSTIFTGVVTVNDAPAKPGDVVGIFVDGECRMVSEVFLINDTAYVSAVLHGTKIETATIQFWSSIDNKVYDVDTFITTSPSGELHNFPIKLKSETAATSSKNIEAGDLVLYPSPVQSMLNISFAKEIKNVTIVNNIGQVVISTDKASKGIDVSDLAEGLYFVTVTTKAGEVITKKIVKN